MCSTVLVAISFINLNSFDYSLAFSAHFLLDLGRFPCRLTTRPQVMSSFHFTEFDQGSRLGGAHGVVLPCGATW